MDYENFIHCITSAVSYEITPSDQSFCRFLPFTRLISIIPVRLYHVDFSVKLRIFLKVAGGGQKKNQKESQIAASQLCWVVLLHLKNVC